jgi:hypothetical protein
MKPVTMEQLNAIKPDKAWVTDSGKQFLISGPQLVGDTLVGYVNGEYQELPTAHFTQVMVQRPATGKTAALIAVITVGFGGMVYALAGGGASGKGQSDFCDKHPEDVTCSQ